MESDDALRDRLVDLLPVGSWYGAEDLSNASGEELDALAVYYGTERQVAHEKQ